MKNFNLSSLTKYLGALRYGNRLRPERDWLVLLGMTVILLIASIAWNVFYFINTAANQPSSSAPAPTQTLSSASEVTSVQNIFKSRATEQTNYQQNYKFVDPSI